MKPCKRLRVQALGMDQFFNFTYAENGNPNECLNIPGKCTCLHAETNLLDKMPHPLIVIVSHSPCLNCAKALHKAGVRRVLYKTQYRKTEGISYLATHNIKVDQI